jgi:nucleotide-binding universal stress UspA family protein
MLPFRKILCPIDFSEPSSAALDAADELAVQFGAELGLVHVVPPVHTIRPLGPYPGTMDVEETACERIEGQAAERELGHIIERRHLKASKVSPIVRCGSVAEEIVAATEQGGADLIVMATHGLTGWRHHVLGSVAEKVLHLAHGPVLVVHAATDVK